MNEIIRVQNLTKKYYISPPQKGIVGNIKSFFSPKKREIVAIDDISFSIKQKEIVGYIGANGAGKSTTIKMLSGILTPTNGEVIVDGYIPQKNRKKNATNIGAVFGQRTQLLWDLPVIESFELQKYMYSLSKLEYKKRLAVFTEIFDLQDILNKPARQLSLGQRMRADISLALLHNPKILYLDEPTIGLDIVAKERVRELVKKMNEEYGTTVILTTHDMFDVENLCTRIILIDEGRVLFNGSKQEFRDVYEASKIMRINLPREGISRGVFSRFNVVKDENEVIDILLNEKDDMISILKYLQDYEIMIKDIQIVDESIENIVKKIFYTSSCG